MLGETASFHNAMAERVIKTMVALWQTLKLVQLQNREKLKVPAVDLPAGVMSRV